MVAFCFAPLLVSGHVLLLGDLSFLFYPAYTFFRSTVLTGHLPLWNPYTGCGEPFLANIQWGVFYPLNLVYLALPTSAAIVVVAALHIAIAGLGTYALCRLWRISPPGSLLAGITYAFNGYTFTKLEFPSELGSAAWFPCVLAAFVLWCHRHTWPSLVLLSLMLAFQCLAGFPESLTFALLALGLYALFAGVVAWRSQQRLRALPMPMIALGLAGLLAMALAAAQLLPSMDALSASAKSEAVDPRLEITTLHPLGLACLLIPSLYGVHAPYTLIWGNYWAPTCLMYSIGAVYAGLAPLVIGLTWAICRLALIRRTGPLASERPFPLPRAAYCVVLMSVSFLYAMGHYTPLFGLLWNAIPLLQRFVSPAKCLLCALLPLSCLAGIGLDALPRLASLRPTVANTWRSDLMVWGPALLTVGLGALVAAALLGDARLGRHIMHTWFNLDSVAPQFAHRIPWQTLLHDTIKLPILALTLTVILTLYANVHRLRSASLALLIVLAFADLFHAHRALLETGPAELLETPPADLDKLRSSQGPVRFYAYEYTFVDEVRSVMENLPDGYTDVRLHNVQKAMPQAEESALLARLSRSIVYVCWPMVDRVFNPYPFTRFVPGELQRMLLLARHPSVSPEHKRRFLAMINCDRILRYPDLKAYAAGSPLGSARLTVLPDVLPRAYVVGGLGILPDELALWKALASDDFDPRTIAFTTQAQARQHGLEPSPPVAVSHRLHRCDYSPNRLELSLDAAKPAILVVADTLDPGWSATVNGRPVSMFKLHGAFRGLRIPEGRVDVVMTYWPRLLTPGLLLSAAALLVLGALLVLSPTRRRSETRAPTASAEDTPAETIAVVNPLSGGDHHA